MIRRYAGTIGVIVAASALAIACVIEKGPGRIAADIPDREGFTSPGKILVRRCGSLDCHGTPYRNYRLFGYGGQRLAAGQRPDNPDTTNDELAVDYDATVGVEPERTREIATGVSSVETSTLIRKARGHEHHAGGKRLVPGSPEDACIVGWLTRAPNEDACAEALAPP